MVTPDSSPAPQVRKGRRPLFVLLTVFGLGGGIALWQFIAHRGLESTDNAQVEAEIVPIPAHIGGTIKEVRFEDNQRVEKDEIIARIEDGPARARLAQAEAAVKAAEARAALAEIDARLATTNAKSNLGAARATRTTVESEVVATKTQLREAKAAMRAAEVALNQSRVDLERAEGLRLNGVISDAELLQARSRAELNASNLEAARAHLVTLEARVSQSESRIAEADVRVEQTEDLDTLAAQAQARAEAAKAEVEVVRAGRLVASLDVEYCIIRAPQAGVVSKKSIAVGQMVALGQPVAQLVTDTLWVTANFKETQVARFRPGESAKIDIDAFPDADLKAEVESIAGATGARFSLLPPDNATGNFTKVVQRVPVRLRLINRPKDLPLRPGLSATVTVDTRAQADGAVAHVD